MGTSWYGVEIDMSVNQINEGLLYGSKGISSLLNVTWLSYLEHTWFWNQCRYYMLAPL